MLYLATRKSVNVAMLIAYCLLFVGGEAIHAIPGFGHQHSHTHAASETESSHAHCCHHHPEASSTSEGLEHSDSEHSSSGPEIGQGDDCSLCKLLSLSRWLPSQLVADLRGQEAPLYLCASPATPIQGVELGFLVRGPPSLS